MIAARIWALAAFAGLASLSLVAGARGQGAAVATLTVLAAPVERVVAGGGAEPGVDGIDLAEGDRVKTGPGGLALITFLNGSTVTVLAGADVTVRQANTDRAGGGIRLLIHAGRVWARIVQAAGQRAPMSLTSNEYTATAHDGLIGAERGPDGFVCWARRGDLRLTDASGQTDVVVVAGRRARAHFGSPVIAEPFVPSASMLEIQTTGPVVPLVRMPNGRATAGFLAPDVEVTQVFGSLTERGRRNGWLVEVPGGHEGAYTLVLTGTAAGDFTATVAARYAGITVYRQELRGEARPGERLFTRITHELSGGDPRTARVTEASFDRLRAWDGSEPAVVVPRPGGSRAERP